MPRQISYHIPDVYDDMLKQLSRRWGTNQTQTHLRCIELCHRLEVEETAPFQYIHPLDDKTHYDADGNRRP